MPKKVITRTGHPGATPNDRRILVAVTGATAAPTLASDGDLLNRNEFIHLLFKLGGTTPLFQLHIWWYSEISGEWHRGEKISLNGDDLASIEVQGLSRVYLQIISATGTSPTLDAWLALVVPV